MAVAADAIRADAWSELERWEAVRIRRPVRVDGRRPPGGEWDWYYALSRGERAAVSRDFMVPAPDGVGPDELATWLSTDVDAAMAHWLAMVRATRQRPTGRLGDIVDELSTDYDDTMSTPLVRLGDLVGPAEVAARLGVSPRTVHQWRWRQVMPAPAVVLTGTALWVWGDVEAWAQASGRL